MQLTNLEKALLHAAKAFIQAYNQSEATDLGVGSHQQRQTPQARPTATSNDIPVCPRHGKAMRLGKYGYHCTAKIGPGDRDYCREKA
jgi:hypothetical protein